MAKHSPMGGSAIDRILKCPRSYGLIEATGARDEGSEHAKLGSAAHKLAEICLARSNDAWEWVDVEIDTFMVGYEQGQIDPDAVQVYINYVRGVSERGSKTHIELPLGNGWRPHPFYYGTADAVIVGDDWLEVIDLKFGAGLSVGPVENRQLMYYGVGAYKEVADHLTDDSKVYLTIVQPRAASEPVKTWETTVGELRKWSREVLVHGMRLAESGEGEFVTGDHCRFCPAILDCPKQHEDLKALNKESADGISDDELDLLYPTFDTVKMFMRSAEARLTKRLMEGGEFKNCKLVNKRSPGRVWKENVEELLKAELGDDAYDVKLKTPPAIEKLSKKWKDFVAENAFLPPNTGYNLVPATDSAPKADLAGDIGKQFGHYLNKE